MVSIMGAGCHDAVCAWPSTMGNVSKDGSDVVGKMVMTRSVLVGEFSGHLFSFFPSRLRLIREIPTAVKTGNPNKLVRVSTE